MNYTALFRHGRRHLGQHLGLDLPPPDQRPDTRSPGERLADGMTRVFGSWGFLTIQSGMLATWVALNVVGGTQSWDPYPFILLNLLLSFQAAYAAPIIMMSQNRENAVDRARAIEDFAVNLKAELEIAALQQTLEGLQGRELARLAAALARIEAHLGITADDGTV